MREREGKGRNTMLEKKGTYSAEVRAVSALGGCSSESECPASSWSWADGWCSKPRGNSVRRGLGLAGLDLDIATFVLNGDDLRLFELIWLEKGSESKNAPWSWPIQKIWKSWGCGDYPMIGNLNNEHADSIPATNVQAPWRIPVLQVLVSQWRSCFSNLKC